MAELQTPTDIILGANGLLDRMASLETNDPDAQHSQAILKEVLDYLHHEDRSILDRPMEEKLSDKEKTRLIKLLKYLKTHLHGIKHLYDLASFIERFKLKLPPNELARLLPEAAPKSRLVR